jgi:Zn finger protein HypA/HybF involved in hydrogenase expression
VSEVLGNPLGNFMIVRMTFIPDVLKEVTEDGKKLKLKLQEVVLTCHSCKSEIRLPGHTWEDNKGQIKAEGIDCPFCKRHSIIIEGR